MTEIVQLSEAESQGVLAFGRAVEKVRKRTEPIQVRLARGAPPVDPASVLVVVVSSVGTLISRTLVGGQPVNLRELLLRLAGAEAAVGKLLLDAPAMRAPQLTAGEATLLDDAGFGEGSRETAAALEKSSIELELLLRESLSLEEAE